MNSPQKGLLRAIGMVKVTNNFHSFIMRKNKKQMMDFVHS